MQEQKEMLWYRMLSIIDKLNRQLKEDGWIYEDERNAYALKDQVVQKLLQEKPDCVQTALYLVPYIRYSMATKDKAGAMMRRDSVKRPFEYYLARVELSPADVEVPEKANVEVIAKCMNDTFSFHMPLPQIEACGFDTASLPRKEWINAPDFFHASYLSAKEQIDQALAELDALS
ncbi:MAG: hypothetical protein K5695_18130 [Oscillospiraceae bacterium]|nr:hypothetical protein [Oscillospiraceae bacterium]